MINFYSAKNNLTPEEKEIVRSIIKQQIQTNQLPLPSDRPLKQPPATTTSTTVRSVVILPAFCLHWGSVRQNHKELLIERQVVLISSQSEIFAPKLASAAALDGNVSNASDLIRRRSVRRKRRHRAGKSVPGHPTKAKQKLNRNEDGKEVAHNRSTAVLLVSGCFMFSLPAL